MMSVDHAISDDQEGDQVIVAKWREGIERVSAREMAYSVQRQNRPVLR